jgi:hypothetical protein
MRIEFSSDLRFFVVFYTKSCPSYFMFMYYLDFYLYRWYNMSATSRKTGAYHSHFSVALEIICGCEVPMLQSGTYVQAIVNGCSMKLSALCKMLTEVHMLVHLTRAGWREGDWLCSTCNNHNYASRAFCNRFYFVTSFCSNLLVKLDIHCLAQQV